MLSCHTQKTVKIKHYEFVNTLYYFCIHLTFSCLKSMWKSQKKAFSMLVRTKHTNWALAALPWETREHNYSTSWFCETCIIDRHGSSNGTSIQADYPTERVGDTTHTPVDVVTTVVTDSLKHACTTATAHSHTSLILGLLWCRSRLTQLNWHCQSWPMCDYRDWCADTQVPRFCLRLTWVHSSLAVQIVRMEINLALEWM